MEDFEVETSEKKKLVLIIDDEEDLRDTIEFHFKSKGFDVATATDGIDGLSKLETLTPDLIILDMNMPRMNGLEFYGKIKGVDDKPKYPVLILTARANMEQLFKDLDVDGFMSKPFDLGELFKEADQIIKKNTGSLYVDEDSGKERARRVCIVESNKENLDKLAIAFLETGYIVNSAQSGTSAIKRLTVDTPDVVVISLRLEDISGDVVIGKLKAIEKTKDIRCLLYLARGAEKTQVIKKISEKKGIAKLVEYSHTNVLLEVVDSLFKLE